MPKHPQTIQCPKTGETLGLAGVDAEGQPIYGRISNPTLKTKSAAAPQTNGIGQHFTGRS
jgi:hypothetical protein